MNGGGTGLAHDDEDEDDDYADYEDISNNNLKGGPTDPGNAPPVAPCDFKTYGFVRKLSSSTVNCRNEKFPSATSAKNIYNGFHD